MRKSPKGTPAASPVRVTKADGTVVILPANPAHYRPNRMTMRPQKVRGAASVPGNHYSHG